MIDIWDWLLIGRACPITSHDDTLLFQCLLFTTTITISGLLVPSISWGILVACANLQLCVFLCDGTVALCDCLKHTETFDLGISKGFVWGHVAMAPGGAQSWWRGGKTWHAALGPCLAGKGSYGRSIPGECSFRLFGRFYGLIIEPIYWLSTHTHAEHSRREQTHKHGKTQEEKMRYQVAVKQQVTDGHTGKIMQRITYMVTMEKQRTGDIQVHSDHMLTILVHGMRLWLLLADISKGADNGDAVGQFLVVLVVVLFEQGLADPPPGILTDGARHLVLIQNHVWEKKHTQPQM